MEPPFHTLLSGHEPSDLRRFRTSLGLTQSALADKLGVTPLTVHRWETGQSRPQRIAKERFLELAKRHAEDSSLLGPAANSRASGPTLDFAGRPEAVSAVAEALRLAYGHQFNPFYASETSRIDPLPHQRIAVYEHILKQDPIRFLLADDAGAGKTIMTGLTVREMLSRGRIHRVLIIPPAGLVGNWERELRILFQLRFRIVSGTALKTKNPFLGSDGDLVIVSLDTLRQVNAFNRLRDPGISSYDLVVFDEAHKLAATKQSSRVRKTQRYQLAEALAGCPDSHNSFRGLDWSARHILLLTATPHMGKDSPYYFLWRLLDPVAFATEESFKLFAPAIRMRHFIRRTKEEMVGLNGHPLFPPRHCLTFSYDLSPHEQELYDKTTKYLRDTYGKALSNRPAIRLAMGVFQRRLASSTWALFRSFQRRVEKLSGILEQLTTGITSTAALHSLQQDLNHSYNSDYFDAHGADDDVHEDGEGEAHEDYEDAVLGAVLSITIEDLNEEIGILTELREQARRLDAAGRESKFEKMCEILRDPRFVDEKCLIFTEHRDTAEYLLRRLEALGYSDRVGQIHGGLDWHEREEQVYAFRRPDGNRFLVATDAAGEGINLQFCRLMLNYDIPWNPARLEQRMGRIHRYGQKHNVQIVNLVAGSTYEGNVLRVLLKKLDAIRGELSSDKVFDVIGRLFENVSLRDHVCDAHDEESTKAALSEIDGLVSAERVRDLAEREKQVYGQRGDVAGRLPAMRVEMERERYLELLPAYVRRFILKSADLLGFRIRGNIDNTFSLIPTQTGTLDWLHSTLQGYPADVREHLSIHRPAGDTSCIWLHPGEPVFQALSDRILNDFRPDALRGCIFVDPRSEAPRIIHLALVTIDEEQDQPAESAQTPVRRALEQRLIGLFQTEEGETHECDIEHLLLLHEGTETPPGAVPLATRAIAFRAEAERHLRHGILGSLVADRRDALRKELPDRLRQVKINYDLRGVELAGRRNSISKQAAAAQGAELEDIKREQRSISQELELALADARSICDRPIPGKLQFLLHAIAIPPTNADDTEQYDQRVEAVAVRRATHWEEAQGASVQDVSNPKLARLAGLPDWPGFDLISRLPSGEIRNIEVKGRADRGTVHMQANEWKQACNLGTRYWLYVVLGCATPRPQLITVNDPFHRLLSSHQSSSAFAISVGQLLSAAEHASYDGVNEDRSLE